MADNITYTNQWLSAEGAAVTLGKSLRTIHRRVANGKLESRLEADGRRTVLVCQPDQPAESAAVAIPEPTPTDNAPPADNDRQEPPVTDNNHQWQTANGRHAQDTPQWQTTAVCHAQVVADEPELTDMQLQMLADTPVGRALQGIAIKDVRRARTSARAGWAVAAALGTIVAGTVGLTAQRLTHATDELASTRQQLAEQRAVASKEGAGREALLIELGKVREQAAAAQIAAAKVIPATMPSEAPKLIPPSFMQRFAAIFEKGQ